ncbi:type II toxin-antitoxin system VapC family toxin [Streptomyces sp. DSM 44917]|uniref:Ribonuclease VapC n=1 Tax=Streptomyces boetiae TaxID=3075541 RepID=A0ABU2LBI6_9ACTN|nr:type II toxin-antitoxin system VapC family toxin [Streptomyces sp. DSM 44917]MDT0308935.1 type II toxin-antitoxin system VapC family toxin [Streptomyces sp. DSM 44917]
MIVVATSVLVASLVDEGPAGKACASRLTGEDLAAPALLDLEVTSVLRRLLRGGRIGQDSAGEAMTALPLLPIRRVQHLDLLPRVWELRDNLTPYDASYVALAETLGVPLVTGDARLRRAPGVRCAVEVIQ